MPATRLGHDTNGTGKLTSLATYKTATFSGTTITGTGAATTKWDYDPASGLLASKTYADVPTDRYQYQYNGKFQLANLIEPGITASSFSYNNAGELKGKSLTDSVTGKVAMAVAGYDEMGRPVATADTDNGKTFTTISTTNANQQPDQMIFGSAGNSSISYNYYPASGFGSTGSPQALENTVLNLPGEQSPVQTDYTYDSSSKRLHTISVNGVTLTFSYFSDSNQIYTVGVSGDGAVTTTYSRDSADPARLSGVSVDSGAVSSIFTDTIGGYNQQDQITGRIDHAKGRE